MRASLTIVFFFLLLRRLPRSTLFPYTTLFRSRRPCACSIARRGPAPHRCPARSEEHTSELQSHSDLVCRLLLEKKKDRNRSIELGAAKGCFHRLRHHARCHVQYTYLYQRFPAN